MKSKANFEKIEGMITTLMQQLKIPGLSISVIADNETIYSKGFGARDLKNNLSATPDTLFGIGSVTKSFTTLAIMQLVEQGKLSLDDPISKYVPFKLGKKDKPILIRHFMSHSSGIPDLETALIIIARHSWPKLETYIPLGNFEDFMIYVNNATSEVVHDPGTRYYYLNTGFVILGRIIEQLSGMKYNDYIKKNILEPLEMHRATFKQEDFEKENDKMVGYIAGEGGALVKTSHPFDEMLHAAGGILTSVRELENYVKMNLNNGTFKGKTLLKPENHKKLSQPQVSTPDTYFKELNYCFGWSRNDDFYSELLIEHGGSTAVSSAHIAYIPEKKMAAIIAGNVGNTAATTIAHAMLLIVLGKDPLTEYPVFRLETKLNKFVGKYQSYKGITKLEIIKQGLILYWKEPGKECPNVPLIPCSVKSDDYTFYIPDGFGQRKVEFVINEKTGKIYFDPGRNIYHKV